MIKAKTILILIMLLLPLFSYAQEITDYPLLGGKGLSENPSLVEVVAYYFNFALIIGVIIAVGVVIYAAFRMATSEGSPSIVGDARNKMVSAGLGIVILFGAFLIVSTLNPAILNIQNIETHCLSGIQVILSDDTEVCINSSMASVDLSKAKSINWKSNAEALPAVYVYTSENYQGTIQKVINGQPISSAIKSLWFMQNQDGIYLYDNTGLTPKDRAVPLIVSGDVTDLNTHTDPNKLSYDKITKSVEVVNNPDSILKYGALMFSDPNYRGRCSYISNKSEDLGASGPDYNNNKPALGRDTMSSLRVIKFRSGLSNRGTIILYNTIGCPHGSGGSCTINIPDSGKITANDISSQCPGFSGTVQSMDINGSGGVVLKTSGILGNGSCQLWTLSDVDAGTCVRKILGESVYPKLGGSTYPVSVMVFPIDF